MVHNFYKIVIFIKLPISCFNVMGVIGCKYKIIAYAIILKVKSLPEPTSWEILIITWSIDLIGF